MWCISFGICCVWYLFSRLITDADNIPIVIPFVHTGMQDIMPVGAQVPRIGKEVCSILFDCSLECFLDFNGSLLLLCIMVTGLVPGVMKHNSKGVS